jgi:hypothetical protein
MDELTLENNPALVSYLAEARVPTAFFLEIPTLFCHPEALLNATSYDSNLGISFSASASSAAYFLASSRAFLSFAVFGFGLGKLSNTSSTVLIELFLPNVGYPVLA